MHIATSKPFRLVYFLGRNMWFRTIANIFISKLRSFHQFHKHERKLWDKGQTWYSLEPLDSLQQSSSSAHNDQSRICQNTGKAHFRSKHFRSKCSQTFRSVMYPIQIALVPFGTQSTARQGNASHQLISQPLVIRFEICLDLWCIVN